MLCYVAVVVVNLLLIVWVGQVNFGGVQAADWQILGHQPGGAIAFDPLLPRVLPVRPVYCQTVQ